jgi:hypothetical protein
MYAIGPPAKNSLGEEPKMIKKQVSSEDAIVEKHLYFALKTM